jgi:A/G-specific adenine glycosylase
MAKLPTIDTLARARPQTVHKLWEGLGYYSRVRNLQQAARQLYQERAGIFPTAFDEVLALPGIGRYTAGAICSIAFAQPKPIVDGNVARVLTRVFALRGDPREKTINARLWKLAEDLVQESGPQCSAFNQSLMELGALVCTPRDPQCGHCPLSNRCEAARRGLTGQLPELKPRPKTTHRRFFAYVLAQDQRFLVRQRPPDVINGHLWEFPNTEVDRKRGGPDEAARNLFGFVPATLAPLCRINHSITRYRIALDALYADVAPEIPPRLNEGRWLRLNELRRLPFASAHKKIIERLDALSA